VSNFSAARLALLRALKVEHGAVSVIDRSLLQTTALTLCPIEQSSGIRG
jgi:hypothetical protein